MTQIDLGRPALALWLVCVLGCVGGQTGESPGDEDASAKAGCAKDNDCEPSPRDPFDQLGGLIDCGAPKDGIAGVTSDNDLVFAGELVDVALGRREYLGLTCTNEDPLEDESAPPPECEDPRPYFDSYVNLVIRPEQVLKEGLKQTDTELHVEFPWPNARLPDGSVEPRPIDDLVAAAPLGARVVVAGQWVEGAREQQLPLEQAGLATPEMVADNLMMSGGSCYGLAFEEVDGSISELLGGRALAGLLTPPSNRFDDLLQALVTSLEETTE